MKKMLVVFAHPDDESFYAGGTIAKYAKVGWSVDVLCATRGEAGGDGDERRKELEQAAAILGVSSVSFIGYMDGTLKDEPPGGLEDAIYKKMIECVPDVVITFDTTGISHHPDHVRMCFATTFAFQKYAKEINSVLSQSQEFTEESAPKLYYACVPESTMNYLKKMKVMPQESYGKPTIGTEDKRVTTVITITAQSAVKKKALMAHVSQRPNVDRFYSLARTPLGKTEYFILRMHGIREIFMGNNDRVTTKL